MRLWSKRAALSRMRNGDCQDGSGGQRNPLLPPMSATAMKVLRIGLTGGIASGKSTVSEMLADMGAVVVDTDKIARDVTQPGSAALVDMRRHFGDDIFTAEGALRRDVVGAIVFSQPAEKRWLEDLLHPLIREQAEEQAKAAIAAGHGVVVFDVPLLFESGWSQWVDEIWTVYVTPEMQKKRLQIRDGFTEKEMMDRISSQWPIELKKDHADVVIDNTGSKEETKRQVETAWKNILKRVQE